MRKIHQQILVHQPLFFEVLPWSLNHGQTQIFISPCFHQNKREEIITVIHAFSLVNLLAFKKFTFIFKIFLVDPSIDVLEKKNLLCCLFFVLFVVLFLNNNWTTYCYIMMTLRCSSFLYIYTSQ